MERETIIYSIYVAVFVVLVGLIIVTPILASMGDANNMYKAFSYTCHQKISRSLCIFIQENSFWIGDCTSQGVEVPGAIDQQQTIVAKNGAIGYKMPVCSRDFALYTAIILGALIYPIAREIKERKVWPAIYLIIALMPMAVDGTLQFISGMGILPFIYESSNIIRILTGIFAGIAVSFYAIPILMNLFKKNE